MRHLLGLTAGLLLAALPAAAQVGSDRIAPGQYRTGLPEVLQAPASPLNPAQNQPTVDRFTRAYRSQKQPRIAVLWNRELSDQAAADRLHIDSTHESRVGGAIVAGRSVSAAAGYRRSDWGGRSAVAVGETDRAAAGIAAGERQTDRVSGDIQVGSGDRAAVLSEGELWRFEQAFTSVLLRAGVKLVDRAAIVRLTGADGKDSDIQHIEVQALRGKADLFAEVLMAADPDSPTGWSFRASVKQVSTGRVLADLISTGSDQISGDDYVATDHGFEKRGGGTAKASGAAVALAVMDALATTWRN